MDEMTFRVMSQAMIEEAEQYLEIMAEEPLIETRFPWDGRAERAIAESARRAGAQRRRARLSSSD